MNTQILQKTDNNIDNSNKQTYKIINGIYISDQQSINDDNILINYNIKAIINCTKFNFKFSNSFKILQIPIDSYPNKEDENYLMDNLYNIITFIDTNIHNNNNILLFSSNCEQRAPTILAIYFILKLKKDPQFVIEFIKSKESIFFNNNINYNNLLNNIYYQFIKPNDDSNNSNDTYDDNQEYISDTLKQLRINVFKQNMALCEYAVLSIIPVEKSLKINYDDNFHFNNLIKTNNDSISHDNDEFIQNDVLSNNIYENNNLNNNASIVILNVDPLDAIKKLVDDNYNPLLLNSANINVPDIGQDCYTFEESILCRSNYFNTFNDDNLHPLDEPFSIYSPNVYIFRDVNYEILDKPFHVSIVATAPIENPILDNDMFTSHDYDITFMKIESIFQIAHKKSHDSLVLTSFTYNNPNIIRETINIFNDCLMRWKKYFKVIIFAILSNDKKKNYGMPHNSQCEYEIFKNYIYTNDLL